MHSIQQGVLDQTHSLANLPLLKNMSDFPCIKDNLSPPGVCLLSGGVFHVFPAPLFFGLQAADDQAYVRLGGRIRRGIQFLGQGGAGSGENSTRSPS